MICGIVGAGTKAYGVLALLASLDLLVAGETKETRERYFLRLLEMRVPVRDETKQGKRAVSA